ncbi:MAG TPA: SMP-30/gluconolactonase/LRE family protein [Gemmatimonadaceae bacterium]|nr:SMP-30/gluconolactonase/LRE family protein [Gemmatimonadaceae bacterium]
MSALRVPALALAALALVLGCARDETDATGDSATGDAAPAEFARAASIQAEFKTPEAVRFDPIDDVFFVSNINGSPGAKDNNGFISRVRAEGGEVDSLMFIAGGRGGVTLNAPKGLAITGDTLWVTDIDAVRAFDKKTGRAMASYPVQGAVFLNDITTGPDGALYITDTGIRIAESGMSHPGPDRIFKLTRAGQVSTALQFDSLIGPNGIAWDDANQRFIIVAFAGTDILAWKPGDSTATTIASGKGQYDGVERLGDGRILVSSWADSSIYVLDGSALVRAVPGVASPADIGVDTKRNRVAVPLFEGNRVELFAIPAKDGM